MKKSIYKKSAGENFRSALVPIVFTLVVIAMIVFGLRQAEEASRAEGLRVLDESIRRAVVKSYAVEGRYPESVEYLETRYGIHIDRSRYVVHYSIFAENIFPEIAVIELQ